MARKQTFREFAEQHGREPSPTDTKQRSRWRRHLDNLDAAGLRLEEPNLSDVARGTAVKAAMDYLDRTGGKPITPIEQTLNVVHKSPEESAASIVELIRAKKKEQAQQPKSPTIQ